MEPTRDIECTVVDLVDTILNKGVVIHADVIITVAGVPLIGVNLRAALAGMETMLEYGMMEAWDESVRKYYAKEIAEKRGPPLIEGEKIIFREFGSHYYSKGIYSTWRPGHLYLTDRRLFLFRKEPAEMLFETPLEKIRGLMIKEDKYFTGTRERLYVLLETGETAILNTENLAELMSAIEKKMKAMGIALEGEIVLPGEEAFQFLANDEKIVQGEKVWYQDPASGIMGATWKPGWMYVTDKRVCWCYDLNKQLLFETPVDSLVSTAIKSGEAAERNIDNLTNNIMNAPLDTRNIGGVLKKKTKTLTLSYTASQGENTASFSGKEEKLEGLKKAIEKTRETLAVC